MSATTAGPDTQERKAISRAAAIVTLVIVLVGAIAVVYVATNQYYVTTTTTATETVRVTTTVLSTARPARMTVTVNGTVDYDCVGVTPLNVTFTDASGNAYTTRAYSWSDFWAYSIQLVNGRTYNVTVIEEPVVPHPTIVTADEGTFVLNVSSTAYAHNIGKPC